MALALDHELADFFNFLGHRVGLANVWIALSADHGISALPDAAKKLRIPAANLDAGKLDAQINNALTAKFSPGHSANYIKLDFPVAWLNEDAFAAVHLKEHDAETAVGEVMKQAGLRDYYTKSQLAEGEVPANALGRKFLNSYSPEGGWYVMGLPEILHRRFVQRHRPRFALHLRHARAAGFLRAAISSRNLSHPCRTHRSSGHAGIAARHQRSYPRGGTRAHRGPRPSRIARKTQMSFLILRALMLHEGARQ